MLDEDAKTSGLLKPESITFIHLLVKETLMWPQWTQLSRQLSKLHNADRQTSCVLTLGGGNKEKKKGQSIHESKDKKDNVHAKLESCSTFSLVSPLRSKRYGLTWKTIFSNSPSCA